MGEEEQPRPPDFEMEDRGYLYEKNRKAYEEVVKNPFLVLGGTTAGSKDIHDLFNHNWSHPIMQVPPQEIKFHKIPMDPGTRAALIFFLAALFCVTGLIAYLIYSVT